MFKNNSKGLTLLFLLYGVCPLVSYLCTDKLVHIGGWNLTCGLYRQSTLRIFVKTRLFLVIFEHCAATPPALFLGSQTCREAIGESFFFFFLQKAIMKWKRSETISCEKDCPTSTKGCCCPRGIAAIKRANFLDTFVLRLRIVLLSWCTF